ncbi:MAG: ankyrin repeat domain-containing protein [Candidatus Endonucleobacter bathymodioli]|uniref:Ankyrin repeat domain-containing protein n=1 Tax=Candidatus Endonucleibacter bathymodioli TaxID=539814 RepID=A0AA90NY21_9GAMM|nr:ankyrin repeat domain-containing protein [Candidatus Endonucleobacter bathymodioli]
MKKIITICALFAMSAVVMAGIQESFTILKHTLIADDKSSFIRTWKKISSKAKKKLTKIRSNCTDKYTLLHFACNKGMTEIIELLLSYGAEVDSRYANSGKTPLMIAAENKSIDVCKILLDNNADADAIVPSGMSVIHLVCIVNDISILTALLNRCQNIDAQDRNGQTALHYVVASNMIEHAKLLLSAHASVSITNNRNETPIFLTMNNSALFNILLNMTSDINHADFVGNTLLHHAIIQGNIDAMRALLELDADINVDIANNYGTTPLHHTILYQLHYTPNNNVTMEENTYIKKHRTIQMLNILVNKGADVNIANNNNLTPLHTAASFSSIETIKILLDNNADTNSVDKHGHTILHSAIYCKNAVALRFLFDSSMFTSDNKYFWSNLIKFTQSKSDKPCLTALLDYLRRIDEEIDTFDHEIDALMSNPSVLKKSYFGGLLATGKYDIDLKYK